MQRIHIKEKSGLNPKTADEEPGLTVWLTGLPSSGKSTLGRTLVERLTPLDGRVELLDGDDIRANLGRDLGFSRPDREENLRRISFVAELLSRHGVTVIIAAISPYATVRAEIRARLSPFLEVFVNAPLAVCEKRDVKGLYSRYRSGNLTGLTGVDDVYDVPLTPDIECKTDLESVEQSVDKILHAIYRIRKAD